MSGLSKLLFLFRYCLVGFTYSKHIQVACADFLCYLNGRPNLYQSSTFHVRILIDGFGFVGGDMMLVISEEFWPSSWVVNNSL